jgi:hypothetical protein
VPTTTEEAAGPNPTIATYIKENNIKETPIAMGDPTAPAVNLPPLDGWTLLGTGDVPPGIYGAAVYAGAEFEGDEPSIEAIYSRLEGNVDAQAILNLAPGEVQNLPKFDGGKGQPSTLGNYPAYVIAGNYTNKDGADRVIGQKTVIVQAPDALYVLQINVEGPAASVDVVNAATDKIDSDTTIG